MWCPKLRYLGCSAKTQPGWRALSPAPIMSVQSTPQLEFQEAGANLPCWSASAVRETRALTAGKVMLDMAATAPAAHIILQNTACSHCSGLELCPGSAGMLLGSPALAPLEKGAVHTNPASVTAKGMCLPWLWPKAVPGQLQYLEPQAQQDGVLISNGSHQ